MSELKDTIQCPICKLEIDPLVEFCPACGYKEPARPPVDWQKIPNLQERNNAMFPELARKAVGPFSFAFPQVEKAFVYLPGGKVSLRSLLAMLAVGLATAIGGGPLLYLMVYLLGAMTAVLLSNNSNCMAIGAIMLYLIIGVPVGLLIGKAVSHVALKTQVRNVKIVQVISLVSAVACFIAYLVFYIIILGPGEGFDSLIDFIKLTAYLLGLTITAWKSSKSDIEKTPFCETCQEYMTAIHWGDMVNAGWWIGHEAHLVHIFQDRDYEALPDLLLEKGQPWFSRVIATFWYCKRNQDYGYINVETIQTRRHFENRAEKAETQSRLVFSNELQPDDVKRLLVISDRIQLPPKTK